MDQGVWICRRSSTVYSIPTTTNTYELTPGFDQYDIDGDGFVTKQELVMGWESR